MLNISAIFLLCASVWTASVALHDVYVPSPDVYLWATIPASRIRRRDDYWYTEGVGAHKLHTLAMVWNDARNICTNEGGHLAIINSKAESLALVNIFQNSSAIVGSNHPNVAAIGFHDLYNEGEFITIHGDPVESAGFFDWSPGQPDNAGGNENCGSIYSNGLLNDINCSMKFGFFCELAL